MVPDTTGLYLHVIDLSGSATGLKPSLFGQIKHQQNLCYNEAKLYSKRGLK